MTKVYKVIHKKSTVVNQGVPKLPTSGNVEYGEIAINYAASAETLSIRNANDEIVPFSSDNIINARIAASGLPQVTALDNAKVLQVVNSRWTVVTPTFIYSGSEMPSAALGNNGDIYLQTADMLRAPDIVYQTDGTSGLLGANSASLTNTGWQLENLDLTPYRTVKFYFKEADVAALTGNSFTPAVVVVVPLDSAALAQNASTQMYVGGANTCHPNDQNNQYVILVAVDSTKTKVKIVMQKSLYGTMQGDRNDTGRYCYKIEGWY